VKPVREMTQAEIGAFVVSHLAEQGIDVVLSGGAAVGIHSGDAYVSGDLDLVNTRLAKRPAIAEAMAKIGFREVDRHFRHPESPFIVEFPPGPLAVGAEPVTSVVEHHLPTGVLRLISPTDCVKDRLATYYHWKDRQGLIQAILVAQHQPVDLGEIERWSRSEGKAREFREIRPQLEAASPR